MAAEDSPGLAVASALRRGVSRLAQRLRSQRPAHALSANKLGVLSHLYRYGPTSPGTIATVEHQQPQSLTRVFAELEADGLVVRSRSDSDGRQSLLAITERGSQVLSRDMAQRDAWLAEALSVLTPTEVAVLQIAATIMERLADYPMGSKA